MVTFRFMIDTWFVQVSGKTFGVINQGGFFTNDKLVADPIRLSADDLRKIAAKVDEVCGPVEHEVCKETGEGGRPKLVCKTSKCNGAELQMRPGMNVEDWAEARENFLIQHPCERVKVA